LFQSWQGDLFYKLLFDTDKVIEKFAELSFLHNKGISGLQWRTVKKFRDGMTAEQIYKSADALYSLKEHPAILHKHKKKILETIMAGKEISPAKIFKWKLND
jgi:hypothetical protein